MAAKAVNGKAPTLVVLQLTGANGCLDTVVPYTIRSTMTIAPRCILPQSRSCRLTTRLASMAISV
jgi:hypothetical protein